MSDNHSEAVRWVCRALAAELGSVLRPAELLQRAEQLVPIAEANELRIEELIEWIHRRTFEKEWTAAEFRAYAHAVSDTRQAIAACLQVADVCPHCGATFQNAQEANTHQCL